MSLQCFVSQHPSGRMVRCSGSPTGKEKNQKHCKEYRSGALAIQLLRIVHAQLEALQQLAIAARPCVKMFHTLAHVSLWAKL